MINLKSKFSNPAVTALILIVLVAAVVAFIQIQKKTDPPKDENKSVVEEVGKLMNLPSEVPTVATVTDIAKLKDQPFFQKAKNGDKVLIYTNSRKAILYDPVLKKIIDAAPINAEPESSKSASPKLAPKPTPTVSSSAK